MTTTTIHVGDSDEIFRSQQSAFDAALAGCPVVQEPEGEAGRLVELAKADLAGRLDVDPDAIAVFATGHFLRNQVFSLAQAPLTA